MDNQEMVMENSWKNILSSLWEPCNNANHSTYILYDFLIKMRDSMCHVR